MAIGALLVSMVMSCWDSCGNCGDQISWSQFTQTPDQKWRSGWLVTGKIHKHPSVSSNSCHPCRQCCHKRPTTMDTQHSWNGVVTCISYAVRLVVQESPLGRALNDMASMDYNDLKIICDVALELRLVNTQQLDDGIPITPASKRTDDSQPCHVAIEDCESGTDLISADDFFEALKLIIGNDGEVIDKAKKKNVTLSEGGRAQLPAIFDAVLSDFESKRDYERRFAKYPQVNMLPNTVTGKGKMGTASVTDYRKGATAVIDKLEKLAVSNPGCIALGLGSMPDRIAHTARSDHVIRLSRFTTPTACLIAPIRDKLDCGHSGKLTTQDITSQGKSVSKIVILTQQSVPGKEHIHVSDDCQGYEVGHLYYGILPHPTGQGRAMGTKNAPDNVKLVQRLFNRDTCGNATLYIQQGHAVATSKLSSKEMTIERKALGYYHPTSKDGKKAVAQYLATH